MSLWWARREQLDDHQLKLIEDLPLRENCLVLGPPGSGKTNVLLRRAQFVRGQDMPNVMVLTFTRPLTEFVKTGCYDGRKEIFPRSSVNTIEGWIRNLYAAHGEELPDRTNDLPEWKRRLATGALPFRTRNYIPAYDVLFVDEAQDLLTEEVDLIKQWGDVLFFVGDDRQKIFDYADGLRAIRQVVTPEQEFVLPFHYRVAPEICHMADRILTPKSGVGLEESSQYDGPRPPEIDIQKRLLTREKQLERAAAKLKDQARVYGDLIQQGDRLGVIVARTQDRDAVFEYFENDADLAGKSKIMRSRGEDDDSYDPSFDVDSPISILTVAGCKGLEFRAVHWLFCEQLSNYHTREHYYTVVTRAKSSLNIYYTTALPDILARAYAESGEELW
ncbi:MAG TPA: AAA family ATPase [Candidatus Angelobacter sp.]|jgi:superfamily I DNA/RNA helicase